MSILIAITGYSYYHHESRMIQQERENDLKAIASLKADEISEWYLDEIFDAGIISANVFLLERIENWLAEPSVKNQILLGQHISSIITEHDYENIFLMAPDGQLLFSSDDQIVKLDSVLFRNVKSTIDEKVPTLVDFYRCTVHHKICIDLISPVFNVQSIAIAAMVFQIDPEKFLFPLIQSWPLPSKSSETLVVRQDGDSVLFLNELRHRTDTALKLRISLTNQTTTAVQAVLGYQGILRGLDYRGEKVLADIRAISGTPWFMISKIDESELFAQLHSKAFFTVLFIILIILFVAAGLAHLYSYQQRNMYRDLYQSQEEFRTTLYSIGDAVITTDKGGKVKHLNPVAEQLTGWREKQAHGKALEKVFNIINENTRQDVDNPVNQVLEEGMVVGLANHTLLISRDKREIPIADSGSPIKDEEGNIVGVVLVFRDQTEERQARKALQESEKKYRELFNGMSETAWIIDFDGNLIDVNNTAIEVLGYSKEELLKIGLYGIDSSLKKENIKALASTMSSDKLQVFETFHKTKEGKTFPVEIRSSLVTYQGQQVILSVARDITDRKRMEADLQNSEMKYRSLTENSPDLIARFDRQFRHLYVNPSAAQAGRYLPEEYIGKTIEEVGVPEQEARKWEKRIRTVFETGQAVEVEDKFETPKGRHYFYTIFVPEFASDGTISSVQSTARDITERKRAEEEIRSAKHQIEMLVTSSTVMLYTCQAFGDFDAIFISDNIKGITGYTTEEFLSKGFWKSHIHPDDAPKVFENLGLLFEHNHHKHEYRFMFKDGKYHWMRDELKLFRDDNGNPLEILGTWFDITERRQMEEEKESLESQLRQRQKLESIGTLASGIAHDFNNLLTVIIGHAQMSLMQTDAGDPFQRNLKQIIDASTRAASLTRQLLLFSRKAAMEFKPVNLNLTIRNLLTMLGRLIGENISIETTLVPDIWNVEADEGNIEQVLTNLAVNARDAMPKGGKLFIKTENVHISETQQRTILNSEIGNYVRISVGDDGEGISADICDKIFDPFFTTKETGKGTGLGLAVVYGIVKKHNGWINVYSEVGEGTHFSIYLPATTAAATPDNRDKLPTNGSLHGSGERILLIEDEQGVLELALNALQKYGYVVYPVSGGQQAEEAYLKEAGNFDLIFSDVVLPDANGYELVRSMTRDDPDIPIILSSGYTDEQIRKTIGKDNKIRFIQKPYSVNTLLETVEQSLRKPNKNG